MLTGWTIVAVLFNIINVKAGWPIIELELLDCPTHHEPVEVRSAEVASHVHGGEWLEIRGIAEDKLTFLSEQEQKAMVAVSSSSVRCDWCPYFYFYFRSSLHSTRLAECTLRIAIGWVSMYRNTSGEEVRWCAVGGVICVLHQG